MSEWTIKTPKQLNRDEKLISNFRTRSRGDKNNAVTTDNTVMLIKNDDNLKNIYNVLLKAGSFLLHMILHTFINITVFMIHINS
jgi:hypothetical protein